MQDIWQGSLWNISSFFDCVNTFTGYFIAGKFQGERIKENLYRAAKAAALMVSRYGSAQAIPYVDELGNFMEE